MDKPLVSICIPTYNRCKYLESSLKKYIEEPEFQTGLVEIVISDNASTDNTEILCRKYASEYSNIKYFRNTQNVRDKNFPLVLSKGNGLLHRLCNDTMQIHKGHLGDLCNLVRKHSVCKNKPFIFLYNKGFGQEIVCNDINEFLYQVSFWITWIGGLSLWHEECIDIEKDTENCSTSLWQVGKICEVLHQKNKAIVFKKNFFVTPRIENKDVSYGFFKVHHDNLFSILNRYKGKNGINPDCLDWLEKDQLFNFFVPFQARRVLGIDKNLQYAKNDNLEISINSYFQNKPYYEEYKKYYRKVMYKERCKACIKKLVRWDKYNHSSMFRFFKNIYQIIFQG